MVWTGWETRLVGSFRLGLQNRQFGVVWLVLVGSYSSELRIDYRLF